MIKLSFSNLFRRKSRTILSLLGIMVGVGAIIVLISIVDGLFSGLEEFVSEIQGVSVREKDSGDEAFSKIDVSFGSKLESIQGVRVAVPEIYYVPKKVDGGPAISTNILSPIMIYAVDAQKYYSMKSTGWISGDIELGSRLEPGEKGKVLIGHGLAEDKKKFIGSSIKIDGKSFRVKGILKEEIEMLDNMIVMSLDDAREVSAFPKEKVSTFYLDLIDPSQDKRVAELVEFKFGNELEALTSSDYSEQFSSILGNFSLAAFLIALVSAIVAGIGIINTILMSVLERFREIGALKAVGWTNYDVMKMVMYESIFIGILGGVVGIVFGSFVALLLQELLGLTVLISVPLLVESFAFAVLIGLLAGIYPAYYASKLSPVQALRGMR
ncbi:MAG: FtsX-like permease family protein [archaeon]